MGRHFLVEWSAPPGQWKCKLDQRQRGAYGDGVSSNRTHTQQNLPDAFLIDNVMTGDPTIIADKFNNLFANIGRTLCEQLTMPDNVDFKGKRKGTPLWGTHRLEVLKHSFDTITNVIGSAVN